MHMIMNMSVCQCVCVRASRVVCGELAPVQDMVGNDGNLNFRVHVVAQTGFGLRDNSQNRNT